jgi:hypothetical protein
MPSLHYIGPGSRERQDYPKTRKSRVRVRVPVSEVYGDDDSDIDSRHSSASGGLAHGFDRPHGSPDSGRKGRRRRLKHELEAAGIGALGLGLGEAAHRYMGGHQGMYGPDGGRQGLLSHGTGGYGYGGGFGRVPSYPYGGVNSPYGVHGSNFPFAGLLGSSRLGRMVGNFMSNGSAGGLGGYGGPGAYPGGMGPGMGGYGHGGHHAGMGMGLGHGGYGGGEGMGYGQSPYGPMGYGAPGYGPQHGIGGYGGGYSGGGYGQGGYGDGGFGLGGRGHGGYSGAYGMGQPGMMGYGGSQGMHGMQEMGYGGQGYGGGGYGGYSPSGMGMLGGRGSMRSGYGGGGYGGY